MLVRFAKVPSEPQGECRGVPESGAMEARHVED
jgi:hypothetical protein